MSKNFLLICSFLVVSTAAIAQSPIPDPCSPEGTTVPADNCQSACINCNFTNYMGTTVGWSGDPLPGPWCPGQSIASNNDQWLGFIAGAGGATFTITPSNCSNNNGVQVGVYPTGCNDGAIACNQGCSGCGTTPQTVTAAFTPGGNYYLYIDGWNGDNCDFTVTVVPPIAVIAQPLGASPALSGPSTGCPGGSGVFSIGTVSNAGFYTWSSTTPGVLFNGLEGPVDLEAPGGRTVTVTYPSGVTGNVIICVEPSSSCFTGTQRCRTVNLQPLPTTIVPRVFVCFEDAPYTLPWGDEVMNSGTYVTNPPLVSWQGCDSTVSQMVTMLPKIVTNQTKYVCRGTCVTICNEQYCDQGLHVETCDSYRLCDSTINLVLNVLDPIADITGGGILSCSNTSITLGSVGSPNFPGVSIKTWKNLTGTTLGNGPTLTVTQPGSYILTTVMNAGGIQCSKADTIVITGNTTAPTAAGVNGVIGCGSGPVQISVTTNAVNPTFAWGGNGFSSTLQSPFVSTGGIYTVTVTSALNGCTTTATATLVGNTTPPIISTTNALINCTQPSQTVTATSNVTSTYAWGGAGTGSGPSLTVTAPGTYIVTVTSTSNGCTSVASATVTQNIALPGATASTSGFISCPSPTVTLNGSSPTTGVTYAWGGPGVVGSGQSPAANTAGTYTVTVTGTNGCISTATVSVTGNTITPNASATGVTLSCNTPNASIVAASTTPGVIYAWNIGGNAFSTSSVNVNAAGTYTVTVTASNNCTETATAVVAGNFVAPNASATGNTIVCGVSSVAISGNSTTPGVTYSWVGPGGTPFTGQTVNVGSVGTYVLVVEATNGCTSTASAIVVPDANVPDVSVVGDTINCLSASATISGASTTPGVSFNWTFNGTPLTNPTSTTQTVTVDGLYSLTVVNPANGCSAVATAFVELDTDAPGASTQGATLTCSMSSLNLLATSPVNNVTYTWPGGNSGAVLNVTGPGTYTVTVTGANGCVSTASAVVAADQNIPVLSTAAPTLTCNVPVVTITTTSTVLVGFAWTGPVPFAPTSQQNPTITAPGTYTVLATASNGCSSTASITVNQDIAPPNASATGGILTCTNTALTLSSVSSTPGTTFDWPALSNSTQNPVVSVIGNYVVVVTGANGCTSTATAPVTANIETPVIDIAAPAELTCATLNAALATTITSANNTVQTIAWSNGSAIEDPIVTTPGTYTVTVTLSNGCTATKVSAVTQDISLPTATAQGGTLSCDLPSINLSGSSATAGATIAWSNGLPASNNPVVSVDGTYILTATGSNGCTQTASAVVAIDTIAPGATIASTNIIDCDDQEATLTAGTTTGISYDWTGPNVNSASSQSITALTAGTYSVVVTANNGCKSTSTFNQTSDLTPPDAVATGGTIDCITGATALAGMSSTTGVSYAWDGPNMFFSKQQNPIVTQPGIYTLTVKGANGCTTTTTAEILQNTLSPNASINNSISQLTCAVTSIDLTGTSTTANTTFEWTLPNNTTTTNSMIAATAPGQYRFEVTSTANGCVTVETITLSQNIIPPSNLIATGGVLDCNNPTISLTGGSNVTNATYLWTGPGGETYPVISPVIGAAGTYTLVVTNPANGCTASKTAAVTANPDKPEITVTAETITCFEPVITLDATTNVATAQFKWTGPQAFTSTIQDPTADKPGTYTVVVTNPANGCTSTFDIDVTEDKVAPNISVQNAQITCAQPSVALQGNSTTASVTYLWTAPSGQTYPVATPTVSQPGNYILVVSNTVNGCTSSGTATVAPDQNIPVVTVTGGLLTCAIPTLDLTGNTNKPNVTWAWNGPGGFTSVEQNPTIDQSGTYTLVVTTPINGCSGQASIVVTEDKIIPAINTTTPDRLDCTTTQVGLNATVAAAGTYTYLWSTTDGNIVSGANSPTPTVSQAAIYTILVTNIVNGCSSTRDVPVTVDPAVPSAIANSPKGVSCYGYTNGSVSISGVTGGTAPFLFSVDNQPFIATSAFNSLPPGSHILRVQDANGCELETSFFVDEPTELIVNLGPDQTISLGDQVTISIDSAVADPTQVIVSTSLTPAYLDTLLGKAFAPTYSIQYQVTVTNANGCRASDSRLILVDRTRHVFVPNIFTPNGSGSGNDLLRIFGGNDVEQFKSFTIYDRWGEVVYQATDFAPNDANTYWNGKFRGKDANPAVFVYSLVVLFKDGETELFSGDITVNR